MFNMSSPTISRNAILLLAAITLLPSSLATNTSTATSANNTQPPSPAHFRVWGPGLRPDLTILPARYFYIQACSADGSDIRTPLPTAYTIRIVGRSITSSPPGSPCRIHTQQFCRGDGSHLIRYKLHSACTDFAIHLSHSGQPVAATPYLVLPATTIIRSADCRCPRPFDLWLADNNCPAEHPQITADLRAFPAVNVSATRAALLARFSSSPGSVSLCHYAIRGGRLYRQCIGSYTGFSMFADAILEALLRQVRLPDTELFVNLGDWPLIKRGGQTRVSGPLAVFSWCGSADTLDIVWPTYELTESGLQSMGRVQLDMQRVQEVQWPWAQKKAAAFWRGRDSRRERLDLVEMARETEVAELFNVSLTNFFFFRTERERYGPATPHISFLEFFRYRWQISVDGTVAAYRLPFLLGGDALVLKQQSPFYEHFYGRLEAWQHFVPVRRDLRDLVERVRWARDNEAEVRRIVARAQRFAREELQADQVMCYHGLLLKKWTERLTEQVRVHPEMEEVEMAATECDCPGEEDQNRRQHVEL